MRDVIHSDVNSFYASVEQQENPQLRGKPVIVGGDEESRHGIVLTASYEAKWQGVKTAMTLWEARRCCPEAIIVPPRFDLYHHYSKMCRRIYNEYTDLVEPFGLDEAWLDITHSKHLFGGDADLVAREISERIKAELGMSVSVGLSWNKIFAKFGSDYKKPDGYTRITPENMEDMVWKADVKELLYVGHASARKLYSIGIKTIGDLAVCDDETLVRLLGKPGLVLKQFALGNDDSPVKQFDEEICSTQRTIKSVGNGITLPFDATDKDTVRQVVWLLGESVCQRMRSLGVEARCISVYRKDAVTLHATSRQTTLKMPTNITKEFCDCAAHLMCEGHNFEEYPIRGLGVRGTNLVDIQNEIQLDLEGIQEARINQRALDETIDKLRARFGNHAVRRGIEIYDSRLSELDPQKDNVTHPVSYFA